MVPGLAVDVRQVHDVVDRVADDDDTGDGLADTQVPVHGGLAEAEHAEHDGGHGNHGVARHHEIPRRGEDDEEGDRHRDAATLEQAVQELPAQVQEGEDDADELRPSQRGRQRLDVLVQLLLDEVVDFIALGVRRVHRHRRPDLDHSVLQLAVDDPDVLLVAHLVHQELAVVIPRSGVVAEVLQGRQEGVAHGQSPAVPLPEVLEETRVRLLVGLHAQGVVPGVFATVELTPQIVQPFAGAEDPVLHLLGAQVESAVEDDLAARAAGIVDVDVRDVEVLNAEDDLNDGVVLVVRLVVVLGHEGGKVSQHVLVREPHLRRPGRGELGGEVGALDRQGEPSDGDDPRHRAHLAKLPVHAANVEAVEGELDQVHIRPRLLREIRRAHLAHRAQLEETGDATFRALHALVPDHEDRGSEGDREDPVQQDRDGRVPAARAHWHGLRAGARHEGHRGRERGVEDRPRRTDPGALEEILEDFVRVPSGLHQRSHVLRHMSEGVDQHEDVVRTDAEHEVHDKDMQEVEEVDREALVDQGGDWHRQDDLEHSAASQEHGAQVGGQDHEDQHDRRESEQEVRRHHDRHLVRPCADHTDADGILRHEAVLLADVGRGRDHAVLEPTVLAPKVIHHAVCEVPRQVFFHLDGHGGPGVNARGRVLEVRVHKPRVRRPGPVRVDGRLHGRHGRADARLVQQPALPLAVQRHRPVGGHGLGAIEQLDDGVEGADRGEFRDLQPGALELAHVLQPHRGEDVLCAGLVALVEEEEGVVLQVEVVAQSAFGRRGVVRAQEPRQRALHAGQRHRASRPTRPSQTPAGARDFRDVRGVGHERGVLRQLQG
mmetsp:Transcript_72648/g.210281  ORF Transcript_72648/g.210281 Transcript_72648/m.210281 type:complete len:830 (-) Transcript_72648:314-2803(-)